MPAKSKAQLRLMYAIAAGKKVKGVDITPEQANEWIHSTHDKSKLPEKKKK